MFTCCFKSSILSFYESILGQSFWLAHKWRKRPLVPMPHSPCSMPSNDFKLQPYFAPTELKVVFGYIFYQHSAPNGAAPYTLLHTHCLLLNADYPTWNLEPESWNHPHASYLSSLPILYCMQTCLRHNSMIEVYSTQSNKCEAFTKSGGLKKQPVPLYSGSGQSWPCGKQHRFFLIFGSFVSRQRNNK